MDFGIKNKVALITGASSGIGYACAEALLREGAKVAICSRDQARIDMAIDKLCAVGDSEHVFGAAIDYTDSSKMEAFIEELQDTLGKIDILVCSSGGPATGASTAFDAADYAAAFDSNTRAFIQLSLDVLPHMRSQKWGRIVYISSSAAVQPIPNLALSNVARAGLHAFSKSLAHDVGRDGVTVNCVMPGKINTDRILSLTRENAERAGRSLNEQMAIDFAHIPVGRYGQPQELANIVSFLCSDRASYLTGSAIAVDGGAISSLR